MSLSDSAVDAELVERMQRRRRRMVMASAVMFMGLQGIFYSSTLMPDRLSRLVEWRSLLFAVWAAVLLSVLATGGALTAPRHIRALMNDEMSREHRRSAVSFGFWVTMITALVVFVGSVWIEVTAREALHLVLTFGIGGALIRFAKLEWRTEQ